MRQQFDAVLTAIDGVELPLRTAVLKEPAQVRAVYDRLVRTAAHNQHGGW